MTIVDTNIFLDILNRDAEWFDWSRRELGKAIEGTIAITPTIYAELAGGFTDRDDLEEFLTGWPVRRLQTPYEAAFLAGRAFLRYRKRGGVRRWPLPDFYIGAHADLLGHTLLTRDPGRYRTYFPGLRLVCP